jgi:hypothetical protein
VHALAEALYILAADNYWACPLASAMTIRCAACRELVELTAQHEQERNRLQAALEAAWRESEAHEHLAEQRAVEVEEQCALIAELTTELERLAEMESTMQVCASC